MLLVTGASGKTGKSVIASLARNGIAVRAMVHKKEYFDELHALGCMEVVVGDFLEPASVAKAMVGTTKIYHICPNMHPQEEKIGCIMINAAQEQRVEQFVYHSVLHPQVQAMPHHWQKLLVEEQLLMSALPFTILQPAAYMQNVLGYWSKMMEDGVYSIPYSIDSLSSMIDLADLSRVVLKVISEPGHLHAIYELCNPTPLSARQIATIVSQKTGKQINAIAQDRYGWEKTMIERQMPAYAREALMKMFEYYEKYDFIGNGHPLNWLLEREATSFEQFIDSYWNSQQQQQE